MLAERDRLDITGLVYIKEMALQVNKVSKLLKIQGYYLSDLETKYNMSTKDFYVGKEELDKVNLTIEDIKELLEVKVIHKQRHYDFEKEQWVGERGYWLVKKGGKDNE